MTYYTRHVSAYQSIATQAANMLAHLRDNGLLRAHSQRTDSTGADLLPRQLDATAEQIYEDLADEYQWDYVAAEETGHPIAPWEHVSIPTRHCCQLIAALQWAVQIHFDQQQQAGQEIN
ncbi:hypothetical protein [Actinobaculum sp. 352]|uniref:hypothetical protein n=1 Tax=Actinobaculum sp. 352 TaxID=2490946 RepID=UPI000F7E452D|nr:hypothetical protein [Actinobaculum sp. 352]RTE49352.1 hypothetical protein EKN07_07230 [Actinobaculum sp. 352]